jgi:NarL family two-component system sensor histidine kinase YdfH
MKRIGVREMMDDSAKSKVQNGEYGDSWPFFLILTLVIIAVYVGSIATVPGLMVPGKLILFTFLCVLHGGLHWLTPRLIQRPQTHTPILILQGGIVFTLGVLSENQALVLGLYLGLSGLALGFLQDLKRSAVPIMGYMLLAGLNYYLAWGFESLGTFVAFYIPMILFVTIYVTLYGRQTSEREKANRLLAELELAHSQLSEYAVQVEDLTLATERQRMARELHDTLAQGLAGLILQLEAVDSHLGQGQEEHAGAIVRQAMERARSTLAEARRAIADLRSEGLIDHDLIEAVRREAERFRSATGITVSSTFKPLPEIPASIGEHAIRTIREGLTNIAKHAKAKSVSLRLGMDDQILEVRLKDDGEGFEVEQQVGHDGHYGLIGLRERARLVGGSLNVDSQPGEGTTLILRIPLKDLGDRES